MSSNRTGKRWKRAFAILCVAGILGGVASCKSELERNQSRKAHGPAQVDRREASGWQYSEMAELAVELEHDEAFRRAWIEAAEDGQLDVGEYEHLRTMYNAWLLRGYKKTFLQTAERWKEELSDGR